MPTIVREERKIHVIIIHSLLRDYQIDDVLIKRKI